MRQYFAFDQVANWKKSILKPKRPILWPWWGFSTKTTTNRVQITRSKVWFLHYWFVYAHIFVCPDLVCVLFCLLVVKALLARTSLLVYHVTFPQKVLERKKITKYHFCVVFFVKCLEMCFWFPFDYTLWAWCHLFLPARALINVIYETTSPDRAGRKGATQMFVQMSYCSIPNVCSKWPFQLQK